MRAGAPVAPARRAVARGMGKELAPRTYDERVSLADAERRCRRELRQGASLSAVVRTLQYDE